MTPGRVWKRLDTCDSVGNVVCKKEIEFTMCSVDHNSTMSDLRDFIKENKLKITTSGPGRSKDKILAEIKAMTTNEVTDKS